MRDVLRLSLSVGILFFAHLLSATAQQGDILVLHGKTYSIQTNPLRAYLESHPGILPRSNVTSSSLWRGYVARWTVKDQHLLLTDIAMLRASSKKGDRDFATELQSVMSKVFPQQKEVPADWFTGFIIVPDGELVSYLHMGYASKYERYIILRVEHGFLTQTQNLNNTEFAKFAETHFAAFKKTDEYRKALAEAEEESRKDGGLSTAQNEEFLRQFYSEEYLSRIVDK